MFWGSRLKEERKRLKITQKKLAETCNINYQTILRYEKEERTPDGDFYYIISKLGFDVQYILTGVRSENCLSEEIKELIKLYEAAPENIKQAVKAVLLSGGNGTVKTVNFNNNSNVSNVNIKN